MNATVLETGNSPQRKATGPSTGHLSHCWAPRTATPHMIYDFDHFCLKCQGHFICHMDHSVAQAVSKLEQGIVIFVTYVDGDLRHCPGPRHGQFSSGIVIAEQHIGYPLTFRSR